MTITIAFDVYGTLIDTNDVTSKLQEMVGSNATDFSNMWRGKQLEYSFRRGLMQNYEKFSVCTSNALDYTCTYYNTSLTKRQKHELLDRYQILPAFKDVKNELAQMKELNFRLYAFSNGSADAVDTLLSSADIRELFLDVISVDELKSFKPNPAVYSHFLRKSKATTDGAWLISSNPFDVIGAASAGLRTVWVKRSKDAIFDPWGIEPTIIVESLCEISKKIVTYQAQRQKDG